MSGRTTDRITRFTWQSAPRQGSLKRLVFTRDALLGAVPIGGRSTSRPGFEVRLDGGTNDERAAVIHLLGRDSIHHGLTVAVCDLLEEAANVIAAYGQVDYELVSEVGPDGSSRPPSLRLVPPGTLLSFGRLIVQRSPGGKGKRLPAFVRIPRSKLFRLKLPRSLGTPRRHRAMLRRLDRIDRGLPRDLAKIPAYFDYPAATRAAESEVIRLVRRWGVLVFMRPENMTSYFDVAGTIAYRRAQTIVRNDLVESLNRLLSERSLPRVRLVGLPTVPEIEAALRELEAGEIDLKEALERTDW